MDPATFAIDLQDANKNLLYLFLSFSAFYVLKIYLRLSKLKKVIKKSQNSRNQGFFLLILLDPDPKGPKTYDPMILRIRIRIHNTARNMSWANTSPEN